MKRLKSSLISYRLDKYVCKSCTNQFRQQRRSLASATNPEIYDVVCVGGGPAGLSMLAALSAYLHFCNTTAALDTYSRYRGTWSDCWSQDCTNREPGPGQDSILDSPEQPVLESMQLTDTDVRQFFREYWSMATYSER